MAQQAESILTSDHVQFLPTFKQILYDGDRTHAISESTLQILFVIKRLILVKWWKF